MRSVRSAIIILASLLLVATAAMNGQTWVGKVGGAGLGNPLTYNPLNTNILYGSAFSPQIFISRDRGYTWNAFGATVPGGGIIKSIAVNSRDTSQILCGVKGGAFDKIVRSTNGGASWIQTWGGTFSYFGKPVEYKPNHPDTVYTMGGDSIWRSTNFGSSWTLVQQAAGFDAWCDAELHPFDAGTMFVGDYTSGIWKTTDHGLSWSHVFASGGNGEIPSIAIDPLNPSTMYAGRYANGGGLLKSTDGGNSWFCISTPIKPSCASTNGGNSWWVTCSPVHPGHVYFGTYGASVSGIYFSRDGGSSWTLFNIGLGTNGLLNYGLLTLDSLTVITLQEDGIYKLQYPTALHVTSPNGGEHWKAGSTHAIAWIDSGLTSVRLQFSANGGVSWTTIADSVAAGAGTYGWTLPLSLSSDCRVRVLDRMFTTTADTSDAPFEIFRSPPLLQQPLGGETWETGSTHDITWQAVPEISSVNLFYSTDSGLHFSLITSFPAAADTFPWTVPNAQSPRCKIRIVDATDSLARDQTPGLFTIFATQNFTLKLFVTDNGSGNDPLLFGTLPGATDGVDTAFGEVLLPPRPAPGTFDVRWLYGPASGLDVDIRDTLGGGQVEHLFTGSVQPGGGGYPVALRWDSSGLRTNTFLLRDTATHGGRLNVDMRRKGSVSLSGPSVEAWEILECQGISTTLSQLPGWNLISVPAVVGDLRVGELFPERRSAAFAYNGRYVAADTLRYGVGYWIKSNIVSITGCPLRLDTIALALGWNMIGTGTSVAVSSLATIPPSSLATNFFGYTGTGYAIMSTLNPGQGYWVKARNACQLLFPPAAASLEREVPMKHLARLTVRDAAGGEQELLLESPGGEGMAERSELPPPRTGGAI